MSMTSNRITINRRSAVILAAMVSVFSLAFSFITPSQAHAVTYSELLAARSKAAASKQRVANLKSQLSGVSASLQSKILELDDLTNNKIPAAQDAVDSANDAQASAESAAQAAADRLAAAQKDKADLQAKIEQTGKDYDDAHAAVAQVARTSLHGSQASDTMAIVTDAKSASDYADSIQSSTAVSRQEAESADSAAQTLSTSKNREQRLNAIEQEISTLKSQADAEAATAQQVANDAASKAAQLESLRNEGTQKRAALESQQSQLQSSSAKEVAANLLIQSQVDSYNQQYAAQQAAAARQAAATAAAAQGSTHKGSSSGSSSSHSSSSSSAGSSAGYVGHPTGDSGNAYSFSQCTWWVYVRRHQLGLPVGSYFGNGWQWANSARALGYTVNHTPSVGAIMVFQRGQLGASSMYGHVAIVERVNANGTVTTSECGSNLRGRTFSRTIGNTGAFWFIHN